MPSTQSARARKQFRPAVGPEFTTTVLERRELLSVVGAHASPAAEVAVDGHGQGDVVVMATHKPAHPKPHPKPHPHPHPKTGKGGSVHHGPTSSGHLIEQADAEIYVPSSIRAGQRVPLLVVFSPTGDPTGAINYWKAQANQRGWIIYASREFSDASIVPAGPITLNGNTTYDQVLAENYTNPNLLATIQSHIAAVVAQQPIDPSRIILAGFSGGAYIAHDLNASYPGFAAAVIDNSNGEPLIGELDPNFVAQVPTAASFATSRREAIFLVGQSDTTFLQQIEQTVPTYQGWGWDTFVQTYPGGHVQASSALLNQALDWLVSQPGWA